MVLMRSFLPVLFAVLLVVGTNDPALTEEVDRETEVRAAVSDFGQAYIEADVPILRSSLTDNYMHVNGSSGKVLGRDEWLKWVESRRTDLENGTLVISDYRIEDVKVVLYGETAVVTGSVFSSESRDGNPVTTQIRFTNVWILHEGIWRRAAFHDSPMQLKYMLE
jgi:ketosteroid isomerase-like protein